MRQKMWEQVEPKVGMLKFSRSLEDREMETVRCLPHLMRVQEGRVRARVRISFSA